LARARGRGDLDKQILNIAVTHLHTLIDDIKYDANETYMDSVSKD
jgi:hypothetical protein